MMAACQKSSIGMTDCGQDPPRTVSLKDVDETLNENLNTVIECFIKKYSVNPKKVIRVPGRVNLIGEHVDYCGFPVCPVALDKAIYIAIAPAPTSCNFVHANNVEETKYPASIIAECNDKLDISLSKHGWISYVACGIQGVIDKILESENKIVPVKMIMTVFGTLPSSAGLSSSSALVCAAFLATCVLNDIVLSKTEMATLCAKAEQYIGTCGGGMDQAIAFHGQKGMAKLVKFNPLRFKDVTLPNGVAIMIANSLVEKNKASSNDFNTRVVECRLGGFIIAKVAGIANWRELKKLADVKKALNQSCLTEIMILVEKLFHQEPYTKKEICNILDVTLEELNEFALTPDTRNVDAFKLKQRVTHVFEESDRVYVWRNWCSVGKSPEELGQLMCKSHFSLQHLYECSHPDLDKLVSVFMMSGAYGARLTGAGWGGCCVALVSPDKISSIMDNLYKMFYQNIFKIKDEMSRAVSVVYPGDGAEIINL